MNCRKRTVTRSVLLGAVALMVMLPSAAFSAEESPEGAVTSPIAEQSSVADPLQPPVDLAPPLSLETMSLASWNGPNPENAPGPGTVAGTTYEDDVVWPDDAYPYARPVVTDGTGVCDGKTRAARVKTYQYVIDGEGTMPLRCGNYASGRGWGWLKLKARNRWNTWWDGMIGVTLQTADVVSREGTAKVYKSPWFQQCSPVYRFIVVTETSAYGDGKKGIITAYMKYQ